MRNKGRNKVIAIAVFAIFAGILLFGNLLTSCDVGITSTSKDPDKYEYGIPLQHVVDIHFIEIGNGLVTEEAYPVFETSDAGWIVYTIRSADTGLRLRDMVFYGPEFWDMIKSGKMSDTNNWQE